MTDPLPDIETGAGLARPPARHGGRRCRGSSSIVVGVLVVVMLTGLIGAGGHGPGRHLPSGGTPSSSAGQGVQQS